MVAVIVWHNLPDILCKVTVPAYNDPSLRKNLTDVELCHWIASKDLPTGVSYTVMDSADLPAFRDFRNAWRYDSATKQVYTDIVEARQIQTDRIRAAYDTELRRLDALYIEALMKGNTVAQQSMAAKRQDVWGLLQTLDLSVYTTSETLKAAWPPGLPR